MERVTKMKKRMKEIGDKRIIDLTVAEIDEWTNLRSDIEALERGEKFAAARQSSAAEVKQKRLIITYCLLSAAFRLNFSDFPNFRRPSTISCICRRSKVARIGQFSSFRLNHKILWQKFTKLNSMPKFNFNGIERNWEKGDIVQITDENHHWFPALIIVSELKSFGIEGYTLVINYPDKPNGCAYIRLKHEQIELVGSAVIDVA